MNRAKRCVVAITLLLIATSFIGPITWSWAAPQADIAMLHSLKKDHPRLLLSSADFAALKNRVTTDRNARVWYTRVQDTASKLLSEPVVDFPGPPLESTFLATSREVLHRVYVLALAYWLDGDRRYVERAWQDLRAAAEFPHWNPESFLSTAEMTHAFAIAYDWLYEQWSAGQRAVLREAIVEKGLQPAMRSYEGRESWGWWVQTTSNWNLVCNGGVALGALALADEMPALAAEILQHSLKSVPRALRRFAPDGGWDEGIMYWHYSLRYATPYLAALQSALGSTFGLGETTGFSETGYFPIYLTGPAGQAFNFADAGTETPLAAELYWLASTYGKPEYAQWQLSQSGGTGGPQDLIYYRPDLVGGFDRKELPLDRYFRSVEVASFRSRWEDPNATFLAFKAGNNRANHGNLDMGTFVLDALGVRWAEDLGNDNYRLPGYFTGVERWQYYRTRTEGQNTLVLNPDGTPGQDLRAVGRIVYHNSRPDEAVAIADLTPAYQQYATRVRRGFALFDNRSQVLIQDEISTLRPTDVWWFMHTKAQITLSADGRSATLSIGGKRLVAHILSPAAAQFTVMAAEPLPGSPSPEQSANRAVRKLAIHVTAASDLRLTVQFVPLSDDAAALTIPAVKPLDQWQRAAATGLWINPSDLHRIRLDWHSPASGAELKSKARLQFEIGIPPELPVRQVTAYIDEELVYVGADSKVDAVIGVRQFADGAHRLTVKVELASGATTSYAMPVHIVSTWQRTDPLDPPLESPWFGAIVRTLTSAESPGWKYGTEPLGGGLNDVGRKVRLADSTEYLVWDTPNLTRFSVYLYARSEEALSALEFAVSADGRAWREVPYSVEVVQQAGAAGWRMYKAAGEVPGDTAVRWFKATLVAGAAAADDIQLCQVELSGLSE